MKLRMSRAAMAAVLFVSLMALVALAVPKATSAVRTSWPASIAEAESDR